MKQASYSLRNIAHQLPEKLAQYLEAQYHIWDEHLVRERRALIDEPGVISREPFIESTPAYIPGSAFRRLAIPTELIDLLTRAAEDPTTGIPATPYRHQALALERFFHDGDELVVSTGTGSGKTETFLMPIVGSMTIERTLRPDSYATPGVRAILLYPMNALVNDQMARLRRLFGSDSVKAALRRREGFSATFGMYTSRTPYPGPATAARTRKDVGEWIDKFFLHYSAHRERLRAEGKWPAKDLAAFRASFQTSPDDVELLTRHEMHARAPDVLVTNYSMLEYMLLRPIDAPIFMQTRQWLEASSKNQLILVLDEAHLYQGAQGTEVALLLRRLVSRLRVARDRVRFILTSASLAEGPGAEDTIRKFAAQLTGRSISERKFAVIRGEHDVPAGGRAATAEEARIFGDIDLNGLLNADQDLASADQVIRSLAQALALSLAGQRTTLVELKDAAYQMLSRCEVVAALVKQVMGAPTALEALARTIFPLSRDAIGPLDGLLAVCAFARRAQDGRVLLPSRAHFLFRGLEGVFACINPRCTERHERNAPALLGKLYARSTLRCRCGSRVYELLTHRDCGAAYLRGYFRPTSNDFLWHEPSTGAAGQGQALSEVHLLVEHSRDQVGNANSVWLHHGTGQLERLRPADVADYLELREPPTATVMIRGRNVQTFDRQCPVCRGRWQSRDRPKIMDLVTKGEDPFAYLIATQVQLQPTTSPVSRPTPNGGRKSLLFSDGRQKAARLARDVPRVIERDAFRQSLLLAAQKLISLGKEARVSDGFLYAAFVAANARKFLRFFDGNDAQKIRTDEDTLQRLYDNDLETALNDPWSVNAPAAFRVHILRTLGSAYYSLYALGLGYVQARKRVADKLARDVSGLGLSNEELHSLTVVWIQGLLEEFALYPKEIVTRRSRELAAGYPVTAAGDRSGFTRDQINYLNTEIDLPSLERALADNLTVVGDSPDRRILSEERLTLVPALNGTWHRCQACTYLAPVTWRGRCAACGQNRVIAVRPDQDEYLRARKSFWRDPVERVLMDDAAPMTLDVEEHTAQLGYRDVGVLEATTEFYERRFRDILLDGETAIDVLSCTTTMEVGIDIGSLIGVGLRNMPPSRHNYQQRAGRAGRRGSAVSTVITFAQNNPHDAYLFDNPEKLIAGQPSLTGLDIDNPILAMRHVYAELLQEYFEDAVLRRTGGSVFAALGQTVSFFTDTQEGTLVHLENWLRTDPAAAEALDRIGRWLPAGTRLQPNQCRDLLLTRLRDLQPIALAPLPAGEEELIEFLFARGVLPAYAFPRDLVSLQIERTNAAGQVEIVERPQQGAQIALSEYAPGRLVVLNKRTYRVGAVTANTSPETVDRARTLFARPATYLQCPNCLFTAEVSSGVTAGAPCGVCAAANIVQVTAIQPQVVWAEGGQALDELDDDQTVTETTVAQLPVPASDRAFERTEQFGRFGTLSHGRSVPLIIMNRGEQTASGPTGFQVCTLCGYAILGGQPFPPRHERHYHIPRRRGQPPPPAQCGGAPQLTYLGYEFQTDVLLLRTTLGAPFVHDLRSPATSRPLGAALISLANALALAAASELDVDPRELQSGHRLQRTATGAALADVYLYDTLAGGAGYSRLIGEDFARIFEVTRARLNACTCESSCTNCLRTYSNRFVHNTLDRHLAMEVADYCENGRAPELYSGEEQRMRGQALREMAELRGWRVEPHREFAFKLSRGGQEIIVGVIPSLYDEGSLPAAWVRVVHFSVHEIEKDLPSCLMKLP